MLHFTWVVLHSGLLLAMLGQELTPNMILLEYVRALGGEAALRAVSTRVTSGRFTNDRGLNVRFRMIEKAPAKRVVLLGSRPIVDDEGSGRGFDGVTGWDKNFIGTGLRSVEAAELADLGRDADILRPLHLVDGCASISVEDSDRSARTLKCSRVDGRIERFVFDAASGLLTRHESELPNRRGVVVATYSDYKSVGGVQLPHRVQFSPPGATVTYTTERVEHNVALDDAVFKRPVR